MRDRTCARRVARKIKRHFFRAPPHAREKERERKIDASFFLFSFFFFHAPPLVPVLPLAATSRSSRTREGVPSSCTCHPLAVTLRSPCARGESVFHMIGSKPSRLPRASLYTLGNAVTKHNPLLSLDRPT